MTMKNFRTGVAAVVGGAVLVAGLLVGASIARADNPTGTPPSPESHVAESPTAAFFHMRGLGNMVQQIADELGLNVEELMQKMRDGATLQELANDAGVDINTVVDNVKNQLSAAIDQKLADGDLTQEQADAIKERIDSFDLADLSTPSLRNGLRSGIPFLGYLDRWLGNLNLGIDLSQLRDKLDSGLSLKEALTELGVDVDSVVAQIKQAALDKIDQLVTDGMMSQDRADELKQKVENFELGDRLPLSPSFRHDSGTFPWWGNGPRGSHGHGPQAPNGTGADSSAAGGNV
jgi:uncharacterized protein YidB (DUF937 family)